MCEWRIFKRSELRRIGPAFFDHVHLTVTLRADADGTMVPVIIWQTLARHCLITAMLPGSGK
jgi:hypothetical protein